jgi:hypothetical protein
VTRLQVGGSLARSLKTTNPIESMISIARTTARNVKRWRSGKMALGWTAAGMLEAERQFRRVNGFRDLPEPEGSPTTSRGGGHGRQARCMMGKKAARSSTTSGTSSRSVHSANCGHSMGEYAGRYLPHRQPPSEARCLQPRGPRRPGLCFGHPEFRPLAATSGLPDSRSPNLFRGAQPELERHAF